MTIRRSRFQVFSHEEWARVEPLLPSNTGRRGHPFGDHRRVVEGIAYRYRTGIPWRVDGSPPYWSNSRGDENSRRALNLLDNMSRKIPVPPVSQRPGGTGCAHAIPVPTLSLRADENSCDSCVLPRTEARRANNTCVTIKVKKAAAVNPDGRIQPDSPDPAQEARSPQVETMAQSWPNGCTVGSSPTRVWWATTRRSACITYDVELTVYERQTHRYLGSSRLGGLITTTSPYAGTGWDTDVFAWVKWASGPVAIPTRLNFWHQTASVPAGWRTSMVQNATAPETWGGHGVIWNYSMPQANIVNVPLAINWFVDNPLWDSPGSFDSPTLWSRCDNSYPAMVMANCVIPGVVGTAAFSASSYPQFVQHVSAALDSGLPGRVGLSWLSRTINTTAIAANRAAACPGWIPRPSGKSCDEYPFASTVNGAASRTGPARSFSFCSMPDSYASGPNGFSRCFIRESDNSGAGATLGWFYAREHYLENDPLWVGFTG